MTTPLQIVEEWKRGCSVSLVAGKGPEYCEECTRGALLAVERVERAREASGLRVTPTLFNAVLASNGLRGLVNEMIGRGFLYGQNGIGDADLRARLLEAVEKHEKVMKALTEELRK